MTTLVMVPALLLFSGAWAQEDRMTAAFEHYEAIRVGLAADEMRDIAKYAGALAPLAESIGGAKARKAVEGLGAARDIEHAREHFGTLSGILVPKFEKAALKDVHFFTCSMVNQSWAQRGKQVENPYMGKRMLTCGLPAKSAK